eukprot:CAMPEP_0174922370 /NCGR_PEP_ID=MMETSP1355-20121228/5830_1 /TAXON_ID=464990 /ORGANISM="Hemiselmis tepida, Strain CCMP443" /LENGTH=134 /DNA_ID=CAMNT_0016167951 /DNA_START=271 /DNA_END=672 /DNA_ORIENTATION=+
MPAHVAAALPPLGELNRGEDHVARRGIDVRRDPLSARDAVQELDLGAGLGRRVLPRHRQPFHQILLLLALEIGGRDLFKLQGLCRVPCLARRCEAAAQERCLPEVLRRCAGRGAHSYRKGPPQTDKGGAHGNLC